MAKKNKQQNITGELREFYIENEMKYSFKLDFQTDLFSNIHFPELPKRFHLYMSDVEFPEKAMRNPNGSLYMNPRELNSDDTNDVAKQLFNSKLFSKNMVGLKNTLNPEAYVSEMLMYKDGFSLTEWFYYGLILNSLNEDTANGVGKEIAVQDIKKRNDSFVKVNTDVQKAITSYITRSVSIITPIIELVGGNRAGSYTTSIKKAINTANRISANNIEEWIAQNIDSQVVNSNKLATENRELKSKCDIKEKANQFLMAISLNMNKDDKKYMNKIANEIYRVDTQDELDKLVRRYTDAFNDYKEFAKQWSSDDQAKKKFNVVMPKTKNESVEFDYSKQLNESENTGTDLGINYDKIYNDIKTKLSSEISDSIGSREEWSFIKGTKDAMNKLKEKTSELVVKRIHHVCKTKESDRKSLVTWPLKANGLIAEWERASVELDTRIKNRYEQLLNGESCVPEFVEQFLTDTYPAIIAMMLTYRTAFEQMNIFLKRDYIPKYSLEDIDKIIENQDDLINEQIRTMVIAYNNTQI